MKNIAVFIGTRPEAVKMAPVIKALQASPDLHPIVISTGQHREMLKQIVSLFDIAVDYDLDVMLPNQTLVGLSSRLLTRVDELLEKLQPDFALVQGDTTTVLMASLACFYRRVPLGHVEAGLRTYNFSAPFPEEANRRLVAPIVDLHFAPTEFGKKNLLQEGIHPQKIVVTGNTVIDALYLEVARQAECASDVEKLIDIAKPFVLITGHRRENFGGGFLQICDALAQLAQRFTEHDFVYPVHLNPNVQKPVHERLGMFCNIKLIPPQDYSVFVALMQRCALVLTDSGGVQEEAPAFGKPVLVMRETTERPEGIESGTVRLVGAQTESIVRNVTTLLTDEQAYQQMASAANPYGDGQASGRIVARIAQYFA
jgi:UDP-N-acetylglucosamine 2-epimerase (non-hydrolysing)